MRRFLAGLMVLVMAGTANAGLMRVESVTNSTGSTSFTVSTGSTVYTQSFPIKSGEYFGLAYKVTSVIGTPSLAIELEQSYELPSTEGSSDTEWVEPDNMADVATGITTETQHYISFSPIPAPYARFRLWNYNGAPWDSTFTGKVMIIEED